MDRVRAVLRIGFVLALFLGAAAGIFRDEIGGWWDRLGESGLPGRIEFGRGLNADGTAVVDPTHLFGPADSVSWVARFEDGIGHPTVIVVVYRLKPDGTEVRLDQNRMAIEDTGWKVIYNFVSAAAFLDLLPDRKESGRLGFRIKYFAESLLAQGDFSILVPPAADPPTQLPKELPVP